MTSSSAKTKTKKVSKRDQAWETMFDGLVQWKVDHHGDFGNIPRTYKHNGKCLYDWIRKQREGYRNSLKTPKLWPCLTPEKIERFKAIGFDLTIHGRFVCLAGYQQPSVAEIDRSNRSKSYSKQWNMMYNGLVEFKNKTGHFGVPKGYLCGSKNLFIWCQAQRQYYRNYLHADQKPTPWQDRIDRLRAIGFEMPATRADGEEEVEVLEDDDDDNDLEEPELKALEEGRSTNHHQATLINDNNDGPEVKKQKLDNDISPSPKQRHQQQSVEHLAGDLSPLDDLNQATDANDVVHDALALLAGAATKH